MVKQTKKAKKQAGFTLIELLAVVTIMGILMMVAIPSVSRVIENTRRDAFANTASEYLKAVRNAVLADNITCMRNDTEYLASATPDGTYYFPISTAQNPESYKSTNGGSAISVPTVSAINGYAGITKEQMKTRVYQGTKDLMESGGKTSFGKGDMIGYVKWTKTTNNGKTNTTYSIRLGDTGFHGIGTDTDENNLGRTAVSTTGVQLALNPSSAYVCLLN